MFNPPSRALKIDLPPRGEDLPYDDGEPMETERHGHQMFLLIHTLKYAWRERQDFFVGGNMFVYYSVAQARNNDFRGPDVFVVLDTVKRERRSWVVWEEEDRKPDVVIELTSESTERVDRGEKMRLYASVLKVNDYFIYDPLTHGLDGYSLDTRRHRYEPITPDARGFVPVQSLGLHLGVVRGVYADIDTDWLRWIDANGEVLPHPEECVEAAAQRAEAEAQRAEAEAQRAEAEAQRAKAEAQRANELEARLAAYERQYGSIR